MDFTSCHIIPPLKGISSRNLTRSGFRRVIHQAEKGFSGFKTAESILKRSKGLYHPVTGKRLFHVMWPPTTKVTNFPIVEPYPEHTLRNMEFWMFDENNASAVIRLPECQIVMMDPNHLMRFREHDIKKLARTQILTPENDNFEVAAKEYTGFAAKIVRQRMWTGSFAPGEVRMWDGDFGVGDVGMRIRIRNPRAQNQGGD